MPVWYLGGGVTYSESLQYQKNELNNFQPKLLPLKFLYKRDLKLEAAACLNWGYRNLTHKYVCLTGMYCYYGHLHICV